MTLHAVIKGLEVVIVFAAMIAFFCTVFFGLRMGTDLIGPSGAAPGSIPLFVEDDKLATAEGRRDRDLFHRWLLMWIALVALAMLLMNYWHG